MRAEGAAVRRAAAIVAAAILLAAGYIIGGQLAMFALTAVAAVVVLLAVRLRLPGTPARPRRQRGGNLENAAFPGYRRIESALADAAISRRRFHYATRPLLQRLLAALLADRRRADLTKDTRGAREVLGESLWPLLDPARATIEDEQRPGPDLATLTAIVDRLEEL